MLTLEKLYNMGIHTHVKGQSAVSDTVSGIILDLLHGSTWDGYANAQLDDYRRDQTNTFRWNADVRMSLRARFSLDAHKMEGTAGFGFWNAPIGIGERRIPSLPAATWFFFAGPRSSIAAAKDVAGHGWKAATIDSRNLSTLALLPTAPFAIPLMRWRVAYNALWPIAQRAMRIDEAMIKAPMNEWHEYVLEWTRRRVLFQIDGETVHVCPYSPRGRMGFVAWIDNQYMVATPQGHFAQGVSPVASTRSLELADLSLSRLSDLRCLH